MNKFSWKLYLLIMGVFVVGCYAPFASDIAHFGVTKAYSVSEGSRQYGNIWIKWEPHSTDVSLDVTITMGAAPIEMMHFTPDTLRHTLNYSNPPQSATGTFIVEFNALGDGGKLYCENFKWKTISGESNLTGFIGAWQMTK